jgi:hypothetical protein
VKPNVHAPTAVQKPVNLLFHRCPYCRHGAGDIHIDLAQAAMWPPPSAADQRCTEIMDVPDQQVVIFQRGIVGTTPCPHTIVLEINVTMLRRNNRNNPSNSHTFSWIHPRLVGCEPVVEDIFWEDVFNYTVCQDIMDRPSYSPKWPYQVQRPVREITYPHRGDQNGRVLCEGWVVCSVGGEDFLEDIDEAARDFQRQQLREASNGS